MLIQYLPGSQVLFTSTSQPVAKGTHGKVPHRSFLPTLLLIAIWPCPQRHDWCQCHARPDGWEKGEVQIVVSAMRSLRCSWFEASKGKERANQASVESRTEESKFKLSVTSLSEAKATSFEIISLSQNCSSIQHLGTLNVQRFAGTGPVW